MARANRTVISKPVIQIGEALAGIEPRLAGECIGDAELKTSARVLVHLRQQTFVVSAPSRCPHGDRSCRTLRRRISSLQADAAGNHRTGRRVEVVVVWSIHSVEQCVHVLTEYEIARNHKPTGDLALNSGRYLFAIGSRE